MAAEGDGGILGLGRSLNLGTDSNDVMSFGSYEGMLADYSFLEGKRIS